MLRGAGGVRRKRTRPELTPGALPAALKSSRAVPKSHGPGLQSKIRVLVVGRQEEKVRRRLVADERCAFLGAVSEDLLGGTGKAEDAKLPGAGIIPKLCPMQRTEREAMSRNRSYRFEREPNARSMRRVSCDAS